MAPAQIATPEEYRRARLELLTKEKELTRARDALARQVQQLPLVEITSDYTFIKLDNHGKEVSATLTDLFDGRRQLVVYHFMFDPAWDQGCPHCSLVGDSIPQHLEHLWSRDTSLVVVSRAPIEKIEAFKKRMGWRFPWVSSHGSDFNYHFHVTSDATKGPVEYNFASAEQLTEKKMDFFLRGEQPGYSTFVMGDGADVGEKDKTYHAYSAYSRGGELPMNTYIFLDMTHLGRQDQKFEEAGVGTKYHDEYEATELRPSLGSLTT